MPLEEAGRPLPRVVRENAERAEALAWGLSATIKQEVDRLQPEKQSEIKFLEAVSEMLDNLASAINEARQATTSQDREQNSLKRMRWRAAWQKPHANLQRPIPNEWSIMVATPRWSSWGPSYSPTCSACLLVRRKRHSSLSLDYLAENSAALFRLMDRRSLDYAETPTSLFASFSQCSGGRHFGATPAERIRLSTPAAKQEKYGEPPRRMQGPVAGRSPVD